MNDIEYKRMFFYNQEFLKQDVVDRDGIIPARKFTTIDPNFKGNYVIRIPQGGIMLPQSNIQVVLDGQDNIVPEATGSVYSVAADLDIDQVSNTQPQFLKSHKENHLATNHIFEI